MAIGLIGRKAGMTQVFQPDGTMVAVSVLEVAPNTVTALRTDAQDGYTAVALGTDEKPKLNKPRAGQLKGIAQVSTIREFRVEDLSGYEVGQTVAIADVFAEGDLVDVTGVSKGKGFSGHVKRHHFSRGPKTHGSDHHREPGSIGSRHDAGSRLQGASGWPAIWATSASPRRRSRSSGRMPTEISCSSRAASPAPAAA